MVKTRLSHLALVVDGMATKTPITQSYITVGIGHKIIRSIRQLKGFRTFETCFRWWMYNSCCTIRTTEVLTLCKTPCSFMNCCGLLCWHPFTLHGTQSITNRKWLWRSPGARANWTVDLYKLDWLISSLLFVWSWRNFLCDTNGQFDFI